MPKQNKYYKLIEQYILQLNQHLVLTKCFNEKSFQHELGQYLIGQLGSDYIVQYERNAKYFVCTKNNQYFNIKDNKKELDIVILKKCHNDSDLINCLPECSIEIKYQKCYPEDLSNEVASPTKTLYEHLRDLELIEQCKQSGFKNTYSIFLADHPFCYTSGSNKVKYINLHNVYKGSNNTGINSNVLNNVNNEIKQYGKWKPLSIINSYELKWHSLFNYYDELNHPLELRYILEVGK